MLKKLNFSTPLEVTNKVISFGEVLPVLSVRAESIVSSSGVENEINISKKSVCPKSFRAESRTSTRISSRARPILNEGTYEPPRKY